MRTFLMACCWLTFFSVNCCAQLSVNPEWRERTGLTVGSSQTVFVSAHLLRGFLTLESIDQEPRNAIANIAAQKKAATEALKAVGISETFIKITSTKMLEFQETPKEFRTNRSDINALLPTTDSQEYSAVAYLRFDIPLSGKDSDELALLPHEVCRSLKKYPVFDSTKVCFLYIGKLEQEQINQATKKAYKEALENAKSIAQLSRRTLGKLLALTPEVDGRWRYMSNLSYDQWSEGDANKNPLSQFSPAEDEVFGNDASKLSRTCSVELRFAIE